jgi:exonuclease III
MRLASYNVENLADGADNAAPLAERLAILVPQLERLAADIICFQEVDATRTTSGAPRELTALSQLNDAAGYQNLYCPYDPSQNRPYAR